MTTAEQDVQRQAAEDDARGPADGPSTEVEKTRSRFLVNPATGLAVDLDKDATDLVAGFVLDVQDAIDQLTELRDAGRIELTCRMDRAASWTWRGNGIECKAASPAACTESYDAKPLREDLLVLARERVIDPVAVDAAVELVVPQPTFKAKKGGINALLKAGNERVAEVIERHTRRSSGPVEASARKATVKRVEASR